MQASLKKQLIDRACAPYRPTGTFNYRWARGKLAADPIFPALLDDAVLPDQARVLDLGCGRGLLAAWLLAAEQMAAEGRWVGPPPPRGLRFRGVELMGREADCGNRALQGLYGNRVQLSGGDMRDAEMGQVDVIAVLDVLHYVSFDAQDRLLGRIRAALGPGGVFVTRVGDAGSGLGFRFSQFVDRSISFVQGHRLSRMWCRPVQEWVTALQSLGFQVRQRPTSEGTLFANVMLVCQVA